MKLQPIEAPAPRTAPVAGSSPVFGLDLMRALAILLVLVAHSHFFWPGSYHGQQWFFGATAFWGVELFFVLSGFLIGRILLRLFEEDVSAASLRVFWMRRWLRTLPNYYLALIVYLLFYNRVQAGFSPAAHWTYFLFLQNLVTPIPEFFIVTWSLTVEEWSYLLLPLLLLLAARLGGRNRHLAILGLLTAGSLLLRFIYLQQHPAIPWETGLRRIAVFRFDAIATGVLAAYCSLRFAAAWRRLPVACFLAGLSGVLVLTLLFRTELAHLGEPARSPLLALFFTGASGFLALLLPLASDRRRGAPAPVGSVVNWISRISYSLYLWHSLLFYLAAYALSRFGAGYRPLALLATWLLTLAVATVVFYGFEQPILRWRDRRFRQVHP
ncbi:acyltransferase [Flaviaesturariibacter flavus]|uniref:Acyltransferase n=1 Tax=Flaviaesturariibacter flavus TaxID=2502780 RepID=A0A4R1BJZ8_9BACT|nr:acyltransferase [Flaviaesturariibacter flavus]TCJ17629.1 acyltransferase [Flaviaesturariibacter flavus]